MHLTDLMNDLLMLCMVIHF